MSFGIGGGANLSPLDQRPMQSSQMQSWMRRRLEDAVEDVFRMAMQRGDLIAAEELLGVIENIHARARIRFGAERRGTANMIERAHRELDARKQRRRLGPG